MKNLLAIAWTLKTAMLAALWLAASPVYHCVARAGWTNDPFNGMVTVCDAPGEQNYQRICHLTGNRTLIAWDDLSGNPYKIYFQILNGSGNELLPHNGVLLVTSPVHTLLISDYSFPGVLPDGYGGCIVAFRKCASEDNFDIYGQRLDSLGNRLWGESGLPLAIWPSIGYLYESDFVSDSLGNFFVGWTIGDLYVQKFNINGQRLWGDYGAPVCTESHTQMGMKLVPDGQGGVEALWRDLRISTLTGYLYFQHLDANGNPLLQLNGVQVRTLQGGMISTDSYGEAVPDDLGGSIWHGVSDGYPINAYYQLRVNGSGQTIWYWNNGTYYTHSSKDLLRHFDGTYYASVDEARPGATGEYVYHFDVNGNQLWGQLGLAAGYVLVATSNGIIGSKFINHGQIAGYKALRTDSLGASGWISPYALSSQSTAFYVANCAPDGVDGAIYPFDDRRSYPPDLSNISVQRVNADGTLGTPNKIRLNPNKAIESLPGEIPLFVLATAGPVRIELFDVLGRKLLSRDEGFQQAGPYTVRLDKQDLPSGVYLMKLISSGTDGLRPVDKEQVKKIVITR